MMMLKIVGYSVLGLLVALAAWNAPVGSELDHTCVVCRLGRTDFTYFGFGRTTFHETECSQWYAERVEPTHAHVWQRGTCAVARNVFGRWTSIACRSGRPILLLPSDVQMRAYQHFKDPREAGRLFESLTDAKARGDRIDEYDEDRALLVVDAIKEWDAKGFPGSWDEWWDGFSARRVEERNLRGRSKAIDRSSPKSVAVGKKIPET